MKNSLPEPRGKRIFPPTAPARAPESRGFALVVTLTLMILLTVIAIGLLTLSSISLRASTQGQAMSEAKANARMALMIAIGELQKAAGPDQRITAKATILGGSGNAYTSAVTPAAGRAAWAGVWKSDTVAVPPATVASYSPAKPDVREFVAWLVSSKTPGTAPKLNDVTTPASTDDLLIFKGIDSSGNVDPTASVQVPKVPVTSSTGAPGSYAYWVEDEGLKADLAWKEGEFTGAERKQAARLSAAPGPDYEVFKGPFVGNVTYPINKDSGYAWLANMDKALSAADMNLVMDTSADSTWLREKRHDITLGSLGVMADVKLGGLRRDLSLAFEMDGTAEAPNATEFNKQTGEFVGGTDYLGAVNQIPGMGSIRERFLTRDVGGSNYTAFSGDIVKGAAAVLRGPNWWAMRDYANLYKRLSGSGGNYAMNARAYLPNLSTTGGYAYSGAAGNSGDTSTGPLWDQEVSAKYVYRPFRANYTPAYLGNTTLISVKATNVDTAANTADLAIVLDPIFYFWNPYNRSITVDNLLVTMGVALPGMVSIQVTNANGGTSTVLLQKGTAQSLYLLMKNNFSEGKAKLPFMIQGPITLAPGEIIVAAAGQGSDNVAKLGYTTNNTTGIVMTKFTFQAVDANGDPKFNAKDGSVTWAPAAPIKLNMNDPSLGGSSVSVNFVKDYTGGNALQGDGVRHAQTISLPLAGTTPAQATSKPGDEIQDSLYVYWTGNKAASHYVSTGAATASTSWAIANQAANGLANTKVIFAAHSQMIKPASPGGQDPVAQQIFARLNPYPMAMERDYYAPAFPNQNYKHVIGNSATAVLSEMGMDFSGSPRGGFWGLSYESTGTTSLVMSSIPSSPLISLSSFSHANVSVMGTDPFHAIGNSWSSALFAPTSVYAKVTGDGVPGSWTLNAQDLSWVLNDALFDRYYLSGMAPDFTISGVYSPNGTLKDTLDKFFQVDGSDYRTARANPVLRPYLPAGTMRTTAVAALTANDGYKKMGAYSLIDGAFNVNSTSVTAWEAFLRANRNLAVNFAQGSGADSSTGTPFPSSPTPSGPGTSPWSGFARLSDAQISDLATKIVAQVRLRGPFMSISDFVNHRVSNPVNPAVNYSGALQAALDLSADGGSGINSASRAAAANSAAVDPNSKNGIPSYNARSYFNTSTPVGNQRTTTGIPGDITQADLLLPLTPRLSARSDTFRIRAYGEAYAKDGKTVLARATCEAVVQRLPEYMDPTTDAANNEPWDEATNPFSPATSTLNLTNQQFGRRFAIVGFRWLDSTEL